jgi:hypothetical protein
VRLAASRIERGCISCGKWFYGSKAARGGAGPIVGKPSIALGLRADDVREAAAELLPRALHGAGRIYGRRDEIAQAVREGGAELEVQARKGVAVARFHVEELAEPRAALGVFPEGLSADGEERVFVVALCLTAETESAGLEGILNSLSEGKVPHLLRTAESVEAVLSALGGADN